MKVASKNYNQNFTKYDTKPSRIENITPSTVMYSLKVVNTILILQILAAIWLTVVNVMNKRPTSLYNDK